MVGVGELDSEVGWVWGRCGGDVWMALGQGGGNVKNSVYAKISGGEGLRF